MVNTSRTFRIFVSSTFDDMKAERNALQEWVFPNLRKLCRENGCRFQAIDLRWSVTEEASKDHRTMDICLGELKRCQDVTPRPNFIVLLGDRYGYRPLPARIPADEFDSLLEFIDDEQDKKLIQWDEEKSDGGGGWYRRDDNADPAEYVLQPRTGIYEDRDTWKPVERNMHRLLLEAARKAKFDDLQIEKFERSASELECNHGVFKAEIDHAFCYFRTITNYDEIDENRRATFYEKDEESQHLLKNLKDRFKEQIPGEQIYKFNAALKIHDESMEVTDDHLQAFCDRVEADLARVIQSEIDKMEKQTDLEREMEAHNEFRLERVKGFLGRISIKSEIQEYVREGINHPLVLWGKSGSGKTALIAECIGQVSKEFTDRKIICRFIGATPGSIDLRFLLESLCDELEDKIGFKPRKKGEDEKADISSITSEFNEYIGKIPEGQKLVIFLDALDQLSTEHGAHALNWFPKDIKDNVRIVVSALEREDETDPAGECLRRIREYHVDDKLVELTPMPADEGKEILLARLKNAEPSRKLQDEQWDDIIKKFKKHGMPLYLKVAFEEAKWWKSYDGLPECMDGKKGIPETTEGAIHNLLWRLEKANNHGEVQVRKALGYIAASRYGLDEHEIMGVLGSDEEYIDFFKATHQHKIPKATADGQRIPIIVWSRLYFDMKPYLNEHSVENASLVNFYHRLVGEVVAERYLTESNKNSFHHKLADFFEFHPDENRKVPEYPWQLCEGESWEKLYKLLGDDLDFFHKAWTQVEFDVKRYWASVERASTEKAGAENEPEFTIVKGYKDVIDNPESVNSLILSELGLLLFDTGYPKESFKIREHLVKHFRTKEDLSGLSRNLGNQANIHYRRGELDKAMKLHKEQEVICRELGNKAGLSRSLGNQALILLDWGKLDEAMKLMKKQEVICRELGDKAGLSTSLGNQALVLADWGKLDEAMKLHKEQEVICRELGDKDRLSRSLGNQATVHYVCGKLDEAMKLHKEVEVICRELGDKNGLSISLGNQALILRDWSKLDEAMKFMKEQETICRELGNKAHLSMSLGNQAVILRDWGKLDEAMKLMKEQETICRELGDKAQLSISLINQAEVLKDWGKLDEAVKLAEEAYKIASDLGLTPLAQEIKPILDEIRNAINNQNKD